MSPFGAARVAAGVIAAGVIVAGTGRRREASGTRSSTRADSRGPGGRRQRRAAVCGRRSSSTRPRRPTGMGHHRVQIIYFFRMQIGSRTPSRIGLGSGSRLDRIRRCLGHSRELWIEKLSDLCSSRMSGWGPVLICIYRWKRPRMRRRRLHVYNTDPRRPRGDLRTTNRQDSADAPAMVASSIARIKKIIFFGPQEASHWCLWTISEPKDTQTAAC